MVSLSLFLLPLLYPAAIVSLAGVWIGKWLRVNEEQLFLGLRITDKLAQSLTKVILSIVMGQLTLKALPPVFSLASKQVETAPQVLLTLIIIAFIVAIVLYKSVTQGLESYPAEVAATAGSACCVCMANPRNILLLPCRHLGVCHDCITRLNECPSCRSGIESYHIVFPQ